MLFKIWGMPSRRAVLASILAIGVTVFAAFPLAEHQSRDDLHRQSMQINDEVLDRIARVLQQIALAKKTLALAKGAPCSDEHLRLMVGLTIDLTLLTGLGYIQDDRLMCSTFGRHGEGLPVGPADFVSRPTNSALRARINLLPNSQQKLVLNTDLTTGFTSIARADVPINIQLNDPHLNLGVYNIYTKTFLAQRGIFRSNWHDRLGQASEATFGDDDYLVAMKRSTRPPDLVAYVAVPRARQDRGRFELTLVLVPLCMFAGGLLVFLAMKAVRHHTSLAFLLRGALRRRELFMVYQPVVDLQTGRWVGAEALVRWRREDGQLVPPDVFIPMAERNGFIDRITALVSELVVRDMQPLLKQHPRFHVNLNFSATDLNPERIHFLHQLIARAGLQAKSFHVEATERVLLNTESTRLGLQKLRELGIRVAIDDFGTGYSSLSYLATMEVDSLKIDRAFVETIGTGAATSQVVKHIIEMAKSLGLDMIAEGVETETQAEYLRTHGVQYAQGWLYARPLSAQDLTAALHKRNAS